MDGNCHKSFQLMVLSFEFYEDAFQFNEDFINISNEDSDIGYFIEAHVHYPEKLHEPHNVYPFYLQQ